MVTSAGGGDARLSELAERILLHLFKHPDESQRHADAIAGALGLDEASAWDCVLGLCAKGLATASHSQRMGGNVNYLLTEAGRRYVVENDLAAKYP